MDENRHMKMQPAAAICRYACRLNDEANSVADCTEESPQVNNNYDGG